MKARLAPTLNGTPRPWDQVRYRALRPLEERRRRRRRQTTLNASNHKLRTGQLGQQRRQLEEAEPRNINVNLNLVHSQLALTTHGHGWRRQKEAQSVQEKKKSASLDMLT